MLQIRYLLRQKLRLQIKPQLWQELSVSGQRNRLPLFVSHSLFFHFAGMLLSSLFLFSITLNGPDKLLIPVSLNTFISATEHVEIQKKKNIQSSMWPENICKKLSDGKCSNYLWSQAKR